MKKFVAMILMVMVLMSTTAFATGGHRIYGLEFVDDFKYKDDSRFSTVGYAYEGDRLDTYIYIGSAFKMRFNNIENPNVVVIEIIRTAEDIDTVWYCEVVNLDSIEAPDEALMNRLIAHMDILVEIMERHGWA